MRIKLLRSLGKARAEAARHAVRHTGGGPAPQLMEGVELDMDDGEAESLVNENLAEPVAVRSEVPKAPARSAKRRPAGESDPPAEAE